MAEPRAVSDLPQDSESRILRYDEQGLAVLTLNRPANLNSMDEPMLAQLLSTLQEVAQDREVRVVVLTGAGRGFCAGGDLSEGPGGDIGAGASLDDRVDTLRTYMESSRLLHDMGAVTVAAVNGPCAGAGLAIAAACDLRFASTTAVFRSAFLTAGASGDFGGSWTLGRILGGGRLRELYLLNQKISANRAFDIGLVSGVFEADGFLEQVKQEARSIVGGPPIALRGMKSNLNDAEHMGFSGLMDVEARRHVTCLMSADAAEAARAFVEKRVPAFVDA